MSDINVALNQQNLYYIYNCDVLSLKYMLQKKLYYL